MGRKQVQNFIIMGYKRHGKDTACEILEHIYGLTYMSSSYLACEKFIFDQMKTEHGYKTVDECFSDRVNHRAFWYEAIREYNKENKCRLGAEIFDTYDIYCGIRDKEEFDALNKMGIVDLSIWIDASDRLPPEDVDSMNLSKNDADIIITNNGTQAEFELKLKKCFAPKIY